MISEVTDDVIRRSMVSMVIRYSLIAVDNQSTMTVPQTIVHVSNILIYDLQLTVVVIVEVIVGSDC